MTSDGGTRHRAWKLPLYELAFRVELPAPSALLDHPVASVDFAGGGGGSSGCNRTRRSSWALAATMIVERLMAMAPAAIEMSMPHGTEIPTATRMARGLKPVP